MALPIYCCQRELLRCTRQSKLLDQTAGTKRHITAIIEKCFYLYLLFLVLTFHSGRHYSEAYPEFIGTSASALTQAAISNCWHRVLGCDIVPCDFPIWLAVVVIFIGNRVQQLVMAFSTSCEFASVIFPTSSRKVTLADTDAAEVLLLDRPLPLFQILLSESTTLLQWICTLTEEEFVLIGSWCREGSGLLFAWRVMFNVIGKEIDRQVY